MKVRELAAMGLAAVLAAGSLTGCSGGGAVQTEAAKMESAKTEAAGNASGEASSEESSQQAAGDTVLRVYLMKTQWIDAMDQVKAMYLSENPQIKDIEFEIVHSGNYWDNLKGKLASEDMPDIIQMNPGNVLRDWSLHLLALDDMDVLDELNENSVKDGNIDGTQYLVPMGIEGFGIAYNMKLLNSAGVEEVPKTWDELVTACEMLEKAGIQPFVNHYKETNLTFVKHFSMLPALYMDDSRAFLDEMLAGKDMNLPENEYYNKYMDFLDLTMKYGNQDAINVDSNTAQNIFFSEQAAMITDEGSWMTPSINSTNQELAGYVAQGAIPLTNEPERNQLSIFATNLCISATSKHAEEAKKFISWFVSDPECLDFMMKEVANMPAAKSVTVDPAVLGLLAEDVKEYIDEDMAAVYLGPYIPDETYTDTGALFQKYIAGMIDRSECLTGFNKLWMEAAK
ncbi:hypothetical protein C0033_24890 [Clostridium sp. chh4-2]|uniref:ABC transporter substrate-binding protein n=1 Tax=Clostridium sp. chh4-2 TaxID=2067550 RepID=UPI000CCDBE7E|nr:extracellular solute-binding protein [Clostridium sp. chh4-2]PNV59299.1 hypothetical protein C0033_24890 [Clostridium sp. chh4-2]